MTDIKGYYWAKIKSTDEITIIKMFEDGTYWKIGCNEEYSINDYGNNNKPYTIHKEKIYILSKDLRINKIG